MNHSKKRATSKSAPRMGTGLEMLGVGGLGHHLFSLPPELYTYILRLAIMPPSGPMTARTAARENRVAWETLAALRLTRKPTPNPRNGLNALFYEATLRCWTSDECVAFLGTCDNVDNFKRLHRKLNAMRHATNQACGADNAAWKRALTAYKSYHQKHRNQCIAV
ncbi:MAG: hypothetical protein CMB11_10350 [Euryarchaeota archaeon]|nr:hypothetical protein [Euryarchaeota archaeon]|tara:strand:- start:1303 stop:1797 length:495 start_codon:yes stop_codon:yes gene_type:complete